MRISNRDSRTLLRWLSDLLVPGEALRWMNLTYEPGCPRDLAAWTAQQWPGLDVVLAEPADRTGLWWYVRHPMSDDRKAELGHDAGQDWVDTFLTQIESPPPFWDRMIAWLEDRP